MFESVVDLGVRGSRVFDGGCRLRALRRPVLECAQKGLSRISAETRIRADTRGYAQVGRLERGVWLDSLFQTRAFSFKTRALSRAPSWSRDD